MSSGALKELPEYQKIAATSDKHLYGITKTAREICEELGAGVSQRDVTQKVLLPVPEPVFRLSNCPKAMITCCGTCAVVCYARCVQDIYTRLFVETLKHPDDLTYNGALVAACRQALEKPCSYTQLVQTVNELLKDRRHRKYGVVESPHKIDYAPRIQRERVEPRRRGGQVRFKAKLSPFDGSLMLDDWPITGLCPHCYPITSLAGGSKSKG